MLSPVAFHELSDDELSTERGRVADAALDAARQIATRRLIAGPGAGAGSTEAALAALTSRDQTNELLAAFERPWALLVLHLVSGVLADPAVAIRDARDRGATVAEIADALGVTENAVYKRHGAAVVLRRRGR